MLKRLRIVQNTGSVILHEIRNLLNMPICLLDMEPIIQGADRDTVKHSLRQVVDVASNYLEYEQLLKGISVTKRSLANPVSLLKTITRNSVSLGGADITTELTWSPDTDIMLYLDVGKYIEIISNLLTNAVKHSYDGHVMVRLTIIDDYLLTEIINAYDIYKAIDANKLYIPSFMYDNDPHEADLWSDLLNNQLKLDVNARNHILPYLTGKDDYIKTHEHNECWIGKQVTAYQIRSTGIGLSIARLLCKTLGGETNLEIFPKYINQWAIIKLSEAPTNSIVTSV